MSLESLILKSRGTIDKLKLKLMGGEVKRFHTEGNLRPQSVAEHSWRVAVILHHLFGPEYTYLVTTAMYHDVAESLMGDVPAPTKRWDNIRAPLLEFEQEYEAWLGLSFDLHNLAEEDEARLKCADYLELVMTCKAQFQCGANKDAIRIAMNAAEYVEDQAAKLRAAQAKRVLELLDRTLDRTRMRHHPAEIENPRGFDPKEDCV